MRDEAESPGADPSIGEGAWDDGIRAAFGPRAVFPPSEAIALEDGRYEIRETVAEDDLSVALRARDHALGRDVTLRTIRPDLTADPDSAERFLTGAQVGGQLQHPGIVPVYRMGIGVDGRPYVVERLAEGTTLADLLAEGAAGRLLEILERTARTVAYAHARDVVHGALTPDRVIVGEHGTVHVIGWGRANGDGRASDLRALGEMVAAAGGDEGLVDLVLRCEEHTIDATTVAQALGDHLTAGEARAREAEVEAAWERARTEEERLLERTARSRADRQRRGRRRTQAIAAAVLVAVMIAGISAGISLREDRSAAANRSAATVHALREALRHEEAREWAAAESWARRARAEARAGADDPAVTGRLEAVLARLTRARRREEADAVLLDRLGAMRAHPDDLRDPGERTLAYVVAFRSGGIDLERLSPAEVAAEIRARRSPADLVAALDDWAATEWSWRGAKPAWDRLVQIARAADPAPWRDELWVAIADGDLESIRRFSVLANAAHLPPKVLHILGRVLGATGAPEAGTSLLHESRRRHPGDALLGHALALNLRRLDPPRNEEALRHHTAAVSRNPGVACLWRDLAEALREAGHVEEAIRAGRRAAAGAPDHAVHHASLGLALADSGDLDGAEAAFRAALVRNPDHAPSHSNLGVALLERDEPERALASFTRAVECDPRLADAWTNLGEIHRREGRLDDALAAFGRVLAIEPDLARGHFGVASVLAEMGEIEQAIDEYRAVLRSDRANAAAYYNLGMLLKREGRLEEAAEALGAAADVTPDDPDVHLNLGNVRYAQDRLEEAKTLFERALEIDPEHALAHNGLGLAHLDREELDAAIDQFRLAAEADGELAAAQGNLGTALKKGGNLEEAVEAYRKALELDPGWHEVSYALALLLRDRLRRPRDALEPFRRAVVAAPGDARYHGELGWTLVILREFEAGITELRRSLAGDPSSASMRFRLARTLAICPDERLRRPEEAESIMVRLVEDVPKAWQFWNTLGVARYRAGRPDDAIEPLMRSIERQGGEGGPWDWLVLALAHQAEGRENEARTWYAKAVAWMRAKDVTGGELEDLRAEAASRLGRGR